MSKSERSELYKFKINLDYEWKECPMSYQQLTYNYVTYSVNKTYPDGLDGGYLRMWGRIQRKFEKAIEDKKNSVDLNLDEVEFIVKARKPVKFPAPDAKFINVFDDELDNLKTS